MAPTRDNIWVTLGKLEWNWKGAATKATTWSIDKGSDSYSSNPKGADSIILPVWTNSTTNLKAEEDK